MTAPRIVTPQEADALLKASKTDRTGRSMWLLRDQAERYAHTVATEGERRDEYARAAVVEALRTRAIAARLTGDDETADWLTSDADEIENQPSEDLVSIFDAIATDEEREAAGQPRADTIENGAPL